MFVDKVKIDIEAGDGGDGVVSFRHEIYVDKGGPDGGDGGNGGNIIACASRNQNTLATYRYSKLLKAENGKSGSKRRKHGRNGKDLVLNVPVGTVITNETGEIIADFLNDGQKFVIAVGGKGGFGNAHFASSVRQVPRIAEKGEQGEKYTANFELKIIADVGLVGLPNAGKSTFLATVSNAKPEIADYPFTTLNPHLGVVDIDSSSLLMADIPGLIEGASQGKGLGDEFLRHVERTSVLLHMIDAYQDDVAAIYNSIQKELKSYVVDLSKKPQIVVLTKIEGLDDEIIADRVLELKKAVKRGTKIMPISAHTKQGVPELLRQVVKEVAKFKEKQATILDKSEVPVIRLKDTSTKWTIKKVKDGFIVKGTKIEKFAARTDFANEHGVERLRDIMRKMGIMHYLERQGIEAGQKIHIAHQGTIEY